MSKVDVQLLAWNGVSCLPAVLSALSRQTYLDFELYILDNASSDDSAKVIETLMASFPVPVHFVRLENNSGFAGGHNRLFALGQASYVWCVNQDAVPAPDYLGKLVEFMEANEKTAAVSGRLWRVGGTTVDTAGLQLKFYGAVQDIDAGTQKEDSGGPKEVFGVSGALPLYRRSAVLEASPDGQLFDESFFLYKEDVDLAWRLRLIGYKAYVLPTVTAIHGRSQGKGRLRDPWRQRLATKNHLLTLVKNLPASEFWRLPVIAVYELGKALFLAVTIPLALAGWIDFVANLPKALKMRKVIQARAISRITTWFN